MKKLLIALVVAGMSVSAMAQTEEYPVRKHSVETNSFWATGSYHSVAAFR